MKPDKRYYLLSFLLLLAPSLLADDILVARAVINNNGEQSIVEYRVSAERAQGLPGDPIKEGVTPSFEAALGIAIESITEKWDSQDIELSGGQLNFSSSRPRFYYWLLSFRHIPKGEKRAQIHRVIILPDGTVVEPSMKEKTKKE